MRALAIALVLSCAWAPVASAQDADTDQAKVLFQNGTRLYEEGRYEDAIAAFEKAYELSKRPALLFNISNAHERLGNLEAALETLNEYRIYAKPEDQDKLATRALMLERRLEEQQSEPAVAVAPAPAPVAAPAPSSEAPATLERGGKGAGPVVLSTVGAVLAVGGGVGAGLTAATGAGHVDAGDEDAWNRLRPVNNAAFGVGVVGGGMLLGGLGWALLGDNGPRVHIGPRSVGATWTLR